MAKTATKSKAEKEQEVEVKPKKESSKKASTSSSTKTKKAKAIEDVVVAPAMREEEIRMAAYFRWEARGKADGSHLEDWLEAEQSVQ